MSTATVARSAEYVIDTATIAGVKVDLRRLVETSTGATAYVIRVHKRDGHKSDANFSGYASAYAAFRRMMR